MSSKQETQAKQYANGNENVTSKGLMSKTMTVQVRYKSLHIYISLPSSAKQQHKLTKLSVFRKTRNVIFLHFHLELNAGITYLAWASSETRCTVQI